MLHVEPLPVIQDNFFGGVKELKVLDMTGLNLSPLPLSLQFLQNLQTLCLDGCVLEDISIIGELSELQVLSFISSTIVQLPREMGTLTSLRLLDLTGCSRLKVIQPNVLSCLTNIEDLYMGSGFVQWEGEGHTGSRNNANLDELKLLSNLVTLDVHIIDANILPRDLFSAKLERFKIFIGDEWDWSDRYETSRTLKLMELNTSIHLEQVKMLLKKTEDLSLHGLVGAKNILCDLDQEGFPHLKHLKVKNSIEIRYIIDSIRMGSRVAFPKLESLFFDYLISLEKIYHGPLKLETFSCLRKLKVRNCKRLKYLFSFSMARALAQLEEIHVSSCKIMKEIVAEEAGDDFDNDETIMLTKLRVLTLEYLPHFKSFSSQLKVSSKETPLPLFNKKIMVPNLADLKLTSVGVEKIWSNQLTELSPSIQTLTTLVVDGCGNLNHLFTCFMVENLAQLKRLKICNCKSMKEVVAAEGLGEGDMETKFVFSKLNILKLKGLPNIIRFCTGDSIEFPSLKGLWIESCSQLKTFISELASTNVASNSQFGQTNSILFDEKVAFPNLEALGIMYMPDVSVKRI